MRSDTDQERIELLDYLYKTPEEQFETDLANSADYEYEEEKQARLKYDKFMRARAEYKRRQQK